ncbi:MAG TPA: phosphate signaling complex protein PhoU [Clostridia bacterium]|jgi:phosphate transport system protein|nr:phosphate signaling complex protein PhoU [Clostridia bacterium]
MGIRNRYESELKLVFNKMIDMCRAVENAIEKSINALVLRDRDLAKEVIQEDQYIDDLERDIERDCLKILLLEHPVASDFRDISAALKMITDLERIADQAADISSISLQFGDEEYIKKLEHIPIMARLTQSMLHDGIQSYINKDLAVARSLDKRDDEVDELFETIKKELVEIIKKDTDTADQALLLMMIAKYLERIGDHAVNVGEWVEYAIAGYRKTGVV